MTSITDRVQRLQELMGMFVPIPEEWKKPKFSVNGNGHAGKTKPCTSYWELVNAWRKACKWRNEIDDALCAMLAVAMSIERVGDSQLFLQVIGNAASFKTKLCEAMLTSSWCYPLEHLTGFYSGKNDGSGETFSLISRINRKCLITPEGNTLTSSPQFPELMGQTRRIFDGSGGAIYKNQKTDQNYTGLRTPWIMAGTPALLDYDQASLGDRFLKIIIDPPSDEERREIGRRVAHTAFRSVKQKSVEGNSSTQVEKAMGDAYAMTGGYVDWLQENNHFLEDVDADDDRLMHLYALGEFTANMRARPSKKTSEHDSKEEPNRLTHQYVRMATCMAVVLNRGELNDEIVRRITKVALGTSSGQVLDICKYLYAHPEGLVNDTLATWTKHTPDRTTTMMRFLNRIGVAEPHNVKREGVGGTMRVWKLTSKLRNLYAEVHQ